jgi:antitoxin Phd
MREMQLRDVKASFSAVIDQAAQGEPTIVTRHGKSVAVVVGYETWQTLKGKRPSFAKLLLSYPDAGEIARDPSPSRDSNL